MKRGIFSKADAALLCGACTLQAQAQKWPEKPVRIVNPTQADTESKERLEGVDKLQLGLGASTRSLNAVLRTSDSHT